MDNIVPTEIATRIGENDFDPKLSEFINGWANKSDKFSEYLITNRLKISKKLRGAKEHEDQRDIGLELYTAYSLLSVGASVICEPASRGPDLLVSINGAEMYVETRRVRAREITNKWAEVCKCLKREVEPFLRNQYVFLGIVASAQNYRWRGNPHLFIQVFLEKYEEVKRLIIDQVSDHEIGRIEIDVSPPLPKGFAKLIIEESHEPEFRIIFPVTQGDEHRKLLRIACEKSRQVLQGHINLIALRALLHESYRRYGFVMLFICQLLFSIRYDSGLPRWIIRLRRAQPRRLSTCWLASLRALSWSPMRCL